MSRDKSIVIWIFAPALQESFDQASFWNAVRAGGSRWWVLENQANPLLTRFLRHVKPHLVMWKPALFGHQCRKLLQLHKLYAGTQARSRMVFVGFSALKTAFQGMPI